MDMKIQDVQFVLGSEGKPTAVLIDITTWERIIDALEDVEDVPLVKDTLALLDAAAGDPIEAGFIPWEKARSELEMMDDA